MKKITLIAAFVIALLPVVAFADFEIILKNTTDEKLVYSLTWLDHPFEMPEPMMMAGGELEKKTGLNTNISPEYTASLGSTGTTI